MAKGFSKVILMGNLTRDVEMRSTPSGQSVANFSLAVNRSWRNQSGEQQEQVSFINCVAWGKAGEIINQYVKKGDALLVSGRLDQRSYQDKDGNKRSAVEVVVEDFNFVGGNRSDSSPAVQAKPAKAAKEDALPDEDKINFDDIPF